MRKVLVALVVVALLLGCSGKKECKSVAIQTDGSAQYIAYAGTTGIASATKHSISLWVYPLSADPSSYLVSTGETKGIIVGIGGASGDVYMSSYFTTPGVWDIAGGVISQNNLFHIVVTYDSSNTANNPVIYVNGVSKTVTEDTAPLGSFTGSSNLRIIGAASSAAAKHYGYLYYGDILTATEVAEIYNTRNAVYPMDNLLFHPTLIGAAGLQAFDGVALAAGNTILDKISGVAGVPTGSPIAVADNQLCGGW